MNQSVQSLDIQTPPEVWYLNPEKSHFKAPVIKQSVFHGKYPAGFFERSSPCRRSLSSPSAHPENLSAPKPIDFAFEMGYIDLKIHLLGCPVGS